MPLMTTQPSPWDTYPFRQGAGMNVTPISGNSNMAQAKLRESGVSPSSRNSGNGLPSSTSTTNGTSLLKARTSLNSLGGLNAAVGSRSSLNGVDSGPDSPISMWQNDDGPKSTTPLGVALNSSVGSGTSSGVSSAPNSTGSGAPGNMGPSSLSLSSLGSAAANTSSLIVTGLPHDMTVRECHFLFALAPDFLSLEVTKNAVSNELTVSVKFGNTLAAQQASQSLERRSDLVGNDVKLQLQNYSAPFSANPGLARSLYSTAANRPLYAESYWSQQPATPLSPSTGGDMFSNSRRQSLISPSDSLYPTNSAPQLANLGRTASSPTHYMEVGHPPRSSSSAAGATSMLQQHSGHASQQQGQPPQHDPQQHQQHQQQQIHGQVSQPPHHQAQLGGAPQQTQQHLSGSQAPSPTSTPTMGGTINSMANLTLSSLSLHHHMNPSLNGMSSMGPGTPVSSTSINMPMTPSHDGANSRSGSLGSADHAMAAAVNSYGVHGGHHGFTGHHLAGTGINGPASSGNNQMGAMNGNAMGGSVGGPTLHSQHTMGYAGHNMPHPPQQAHLSSVHHQQSQQLHAQHQHPSSTQHSNPLQHQQMSQHHTNSVMSGGLVAAGNGMAMSDAQKLPPPNPADQNPPCNTLYVGNLPPDTSEVELKDLFSQQPGYRRLCFRTKQNGPMCFVEFEDEVLAGKALASLYGYTLSNSVKGGIRLSYSKNPLGVRSRPVRK